MRRQSLRYFVEVRHRETEISRNFSYRRELWCSEACVNQHAEREIGMERKTQRASGQKWISS